MQLPTTFSLAELAKLAETAAIDTVVVADTDMQGRLYGKRLSASHILKSGKDGVPTLAGALRYCRDFFLLFAPTTNSNKRLMPNTFAPARIGRAEDNRTVALRIVGQGLGKRIENLIPGADVNPYLAYSARLSLPKRKPYPWAMQRVTVS